MRDVFTRAGPSLSLQRYHNGISTDCALRSTRYTRYLLRLGRTAPERLHHRLATDMEALAFRDTVMLVCLTPFPLSNLI